MISKISVVLTVLAACLLVSGKAHGQAPSFVFDTFQCSPESCSETTPPVFLGAVEVTFEATCTNGDISGVFGLSGFAEAHVGRITGCTDPYVAHAEIDTHGTELLDDCGDPYFVDTVAELSEIFSLTDVIVFHRTSEQSCDGSETGVLVFGEIPC